MARCVWQHGRAAAGELRSPVSRAELMDAVSHTQSGAPVGVRSLGFAADAVRFALDLLSQSRAEASPTLFAPCRLDHARVGWRVLRFLGKTFFAASLELTPQAALRCQRSGDFAQRKTFLARAGFVAIIGPMR